MDKTAEHYLTMLERLIKNKDNYNIIEINQSVFEILEYMKSNFKLEIELDHKNILSEKSLKYLKNTIRYVK